MGKHRKTYTQGFVADVDGVTREEIPIIKGRVEGDAFLFSSVVSSNRADHSADNE
jgi:hypothetical protein